LETTKEQIHDAVRALNEILNSQRQRSIPQTGKYRLAKLHRVLEPLSLEIEKTRNALVLQFGEETFADVQKTMSTGWNVKEGGPNMAPYLEAWNAVRAEAVEVPVTPIPLGALGDATNGLEVIEFRLLADFITE